MKVVTFQQAIKMSNGCAKRHLLLGNGFSIACVPTIFSYGSLYKEADFSLIPEVKKVFEALKTQDFELVIHALENSSKLLPIYNPKLKYTTAKLYSDAQALKNLLIETIAAKHPAYPSTIEEEKYVACIKFLSYFLGKESNVYSLNYDLLLYWTVMYGLENKLIEKASDGFGRETDISNGEVVVSDYVTWQGESNAHGQNIHYLHGAIHVFDKGPEIEKFTWVGTQVPLINQAREALENGRFPLFVAEGNNTGKLDKITHSGYLYHSYKSFAACMAVKPRGGENCLFTYGVSFSDNDYHILKKIYKGRVTHLFVSIFGDPTTRQNKAIKKAVEELKRKRLDGSLEVTYYDASTAEVWGN